jgi:hypothetical protein
MELVGSQTFWPMEDDIQRGQDVLTGGRDLGDLVDLVDSTGGRQKGSGGVTLLKRTGVGAVKTTGGDNPLDRTQGFQGRHPLFVETHRAVEQ